MNHNWWTQRKDVGLGEQGCPVEVHFLVARCHHVRYFTFKTWLIVLLERQGSAILYQMDIGISSAIQASCSDGLS